MSGLAVPSRHAFHQDFTMSTGETITVVRDDVLKLWVISDNANMGPHIIRLKMERDNLITTDYLLGGDEGVLPIARFLAPTLFNLQSEPNISPEEREISVNIKKELILSLSLRSRDPSTVRELSELLNSKCLSKLEPKQATS